MTRDDDSEDSIDLLVDKLRWLRLPVMARLVPSLPDQAGKHNLTSLAILLDGKGYRPTKHTTT